MTDDPDAAPRYTDRPFPGYRFRPGHTPHPTRDPQGHSYGSHPPSVERFEPSEWRRCQEYLYGVDLFNHGYWWEAHEAWEAVWLAAGRDTGLGQFVQGLIQAAASLLKHSLDQPTGAERLWAAAYGRLRCAESPFLGIQVGTLRRQMDEHLAGRRRLPPRIELADIEVDQPSD